jgi:hypothetical protein
MKVEKKNPTFCIQLTFDQSYHRDPHLFCDDLFNNGQVLIEDVWKL